MKKLIILTLLILALLIIGCQPPQGFIYQYRTTPKKWKNFNMGKKYGAKIGKLSENIYWVDYDFVFDLHSGNYERNYYLLRSAELTKEKGFEYFIILIENRDGSGNTSDQMIIQCFKNKPSQKDFSELGDLIVAYNADIIMDNLKYLYNGKKAYKRKDIHTKIDLNK